MAFPAVNAAVEYWDDLITSQTGIIEALNGTTADIRMDIDSRLEEGVAWEVPGSGYRPYRGYKQLPA